MNKAQFFKYLQSGRPIKMISYHNQPVPDYHSLSAVRWAVKVQTNAVQFNDGGWLHKDDIKASDVTSVAAGSDLPAVNVGWAVYQLVKETA